jgi:hypothetical protein
MFPFETISTGRLPSLNHDRNDSRPKPAPCSAFYDLFSHPSEIEASIWGCSRPPQGACVRGNIEGVE